MDSERERKPKPPPRPKGPGGRVETKFHLITRCNNCASEIQVMDQIRVTDKCKSCGTDLHTCRNCRHFSAHAHNQCDETQAEWVRDKERSNFCDYFETARAVSPCRTATSAADATSPS